MISGAPGPYESRYGPQWLVCLVPFDPVDSVRHSARVHVIMTTWLETIYG